jgi:hypothetical protein
MFGAWWTGLASESGSVGAGAYSAATPVANLPRGQVARYDGFGVGTAQLADGVVYETLSDIAITTDFSDVSIDSTGTVAFSLADGSQRLSDDLDFRGEGAVNGAAFSVPVSGPATAGQADGVFHGPDAGEVAGTYGLTGAGGVTHIGAFGAN